MIYKLVKNSAEKTAQIVESTSGTIIHTYSMDDSNYEQQAKIYLRALNSGGGFDGWTPEFILCRAC